jgi:hypothetical protein
MRRPTYFVSFGGFNLQQVTNVHDENGREITEYDGVGSGKFNVPEARAPHTWKIDCTLEEDPPAAADSWSASEIFKAMDALLENSTQPSRLVVTNSVYPAANLSVLAWFKNYSKDEKEPGVYTTTVELEEYKQVGVKTTEIPTVARPGKVPVPSKITVSFSNAASGTSTIKTASSLKVTNPKTGKPTTNDANIKTGTAWNISKPAGGSITKSQNNADNPNSGFLIQKAVDTIKQAVNKFIFGHY